MPVLFLRRRGGKYLSFGILELDLVAVVKFIGTNLSYSGSRTTSPACYVVVLVNVVTYFVCLGYTKCCIVGWLTMTPR